MPYWVDRALVVFLLLGTAFSLAGLGAAGRWEPGVRRDRARLTFSSMIALGLGSTLVRAGEDGILPHAWHLIGGAGELLALVGLGGLVLSIRRYGLGASRHI